MIEEPETEKKKSEKRSVHEETKEADLPSKEVLVDTEATEGR